MNPLSKFKFIKKEQILSLIQRGLSIREMALELNVSESVIKSRLSLWKISCKKESKFKLDLYQKLRDDDLKETEIKWIKENFNPEDNESNKINLVSKKIDIFELEKYYNLFYGTNDMAKVKLWENEIAKGFPYPDLEDSQWDARFLKLVNDDSETYSPKENTALLCNVYYPQMYSHLFKAYHNKEVLIKNRIKYADRITKGSLLTGLKLLTKETRTNFSPLIAKKTLDILSKGNSCNILDYSMGFGGRLLGVMASKANHNYFGIEPWKENIESAKKMLTAIDRNRQGSSERCRTFNCGSETYIPLLECKMDIAFSSPPYFNYEKYVEEDTQSYIKFPKYQDWLENYWRATVKNIRRYLKEDGIFALNIRDIKNFNLEKDMCNIAYDEGFYMYDTMKYTLKGRMQNFNVTKTEPIFIFKKRN